MGEGFVSRSGWSGLLSAWMMETLSVNPLQSVYSGTS